jgi:hypothetical protein
MERAYMKALLVVITLMTTVLFDLDVLAQETDARALLDRMDAEIADIESFVLQGDAYVDARLPAGQIIEHSSEVTARVHRPGMMRITRLEAENKSDIFFNNGLLTVYNEKDNFYAQTRTPEGIDSAADFALNEVGIDSPFLDFVSRQFSGQLAEDAREVQHLGKSLIRGKIHDHIGIRADEVDIQIWIASEGRPLPGKMAISSKWESGSPRFVVFFTWDTEAKIPSDMFEFEPPETAIEIGFDLEAQQSGAE